LELVRNPNIKVWKGKERFNQGSKLLRHYKVICGQNQTVGPHTFIMIGPDFSGAPIFNILLGFFPIFNIFQAPFLNISIFFLISQNVLRQIISRSVQLYIQSNECPFQEILGGKRGASAACHGTTHAHAEGTPRVTARGLLARFIASLHTLVARPGSNPTIYNTFVGLGLNIQYFCGPWTQYSIFQYKGVWAQNCEGR
jgi:hypothetical protein